MVTMGARLLVNSRDQELNLLHSILFSSSKEGSNTSVSITASDNDDSRLELADGTVISGSSLIAERLLRESHSTLDLFGVSELDYAEIHQWLSYASMTVKPAVQADDKSQCKAFAKFLNEHLTTKTFMVSNTLTAADLFLVANIHPYMVKVTEKLRGELFHFTRWFDLIQHLIRREEAGGANINFPLIPINLDYKPHPEIPAGLSLKESTDAAQGPVKKKPEVSEKPEKQPVSDETTKPAKKEKKQKEKPAEPVELASYNPARLDIRVGRIVEVNQHENADSLYVERIDLGESSGPRTIVSGLVKHVPIAEMRDRMVVVLCNLKPASMRGVKSEGMVLAATGVDGKVELLAPPSGSKPGDKVIFETFTEGTPDAVLNPKKKVWETIQPGLFTDDSLVACYKVQSAEASDSVCRMQTINGGLITVPTVKKATIK